MELKITQRTETFWEITRELEITGNSGRITEKLLDNYPENTRNLSWFEEYIYSSFKIGMTPETLTLNVKLYMTPASKGVELPGWFL